MSVESPLRSGADRPLGLIETLRYEPAYGCLRAEHHVARMVASARHFQKMFDEQAALAKLSDIKSNSPLRVRMYLGEDDVLSLSTQTFVPLAQGKVWRVAIAKTKLDADNPLLQHKTSLRQTYEAARAEYATELADEVLLTNQHDHVCEGTITNLFVQKGERLVTPPLKDGLLRGILRQELLRKELAIEGTIVPSDLTAHPFFVGNALRGLIPARLIEMIP